MHGMYICFSLPVSTHIAFLVLSLINKTDYFRCHVSKSFRAVNGLIKDLDLGKNIIIKYRLWLRSQGTKPL